MQQLGWIAKATYLLKNANLSRLHILYDSVYITVTNEKNREVKKRLVVPGPSCLTGWIMLKNSIWGFP